MKNQNHGGPAFPQPCDETGFCSNNEFGQIGGGMTLRDYFAAKAMPALLLEMHQTGMAPIKGIAAVALEVADAMLTERERAR